MVKIVANLLSKVLIKKLDLQGDENEKVTRYQVAIMSFLNISINNAPVFVSAVVINKTNSEFNPSPRRRSRLDKYTSE